MNNIDITAQIKRFSDDWSQRGYEKGETQPFWLAFLQKVLNVADPDKIIQFEKPVKISDQIKYIDGYISRTKILIEQKSIGVDLFKAEIQSDGSQLTTFQQAKRYADNLPYSERPRWIIISNFKEFYIYDLVDMNSLEYLLDTKKIYQPMHFFLYELRFFYPKLKFIVDPNITDVKPEVKTSIDAAFIIKTIYSAFEKNYQRSNTPNYKNFLDKLCTRLVFCFYAAYAQIFDRISFFNYLKKFNDTQKRLDSLQNVFDVLDTPENQRNNFDDDIKSFPHVNGGLFKDKIPLPNSNIFDGDPVDAIFTANNPEKLDWRKISPPIFGSMFESILNNQTRRAGGMHYTSIENIHKVIDPLFLDDLHNDFINAKNKRIKNRPQALLDLQNKISNLIFLDPACGSCNFLTETFLCLRRLENKILDELRALNVVLPDNPVKVSIEQFFGIEINSFAVAVAQTALWIAENQMLQETNGKFAMNISEFPIKKYGRIICANALQLDWNIFAPNVNYIIGNPPFVGFTYQNPEQKADMKKIFTNIKNLDYVCCWFKKAADFMRNNNVRAALVSTNSICQGDSVGSLWKNLFAEGIHIDFAHRTFKWLSDSDNMAHVHCIIVGFSSAPNSKPKIIFDGDKIHFAQNINAYLVDGDDIFVESRTNPLQNFVPPMIKGNYGYDGGNLMIEADELENFLIKEPQAKKFIRSAIGGNEFINGKLRYCLWLENITPDELKSMSNVYQRVKNVRDFRLSSKRDVTRKLADTPQLFAEIRQPSNDYIMIPQISSERRKYIPIGFFSSEIIATAQSLIIPNADLYHFGILTSSIHMCWLKTVGGRLKSDYRYSKDVVYNNFPWCEPSERHRRIIEDTARKILTVRADFPDYTFAKLYDEEKMPDELRLAHKANDYAVALAYGFEKFLDDEARIVAELMKMYKKLSGE